MHRMNLMLAEMGDTTFRLGNVVEDSYENIFFGETMQNIAQQAATKPLLDAQTAPTTSIVAPTQLEITYRSEIFTDTGQRVTSARKTCP